jgi:hypothetical protein
VLAQTAAVLGMSKLGIGPLVRKANRADFKTIVVRPLFMRGGGVPNARGAGRRRCDQDMSTTS